MSTCPGCDDTGWNSYEHQGARVESPCPNCLAAAADPLLDPIAALLAAPPSDAVQAQACPVLIPGTGELSNITATIGGREVDFGRPGTVDYERKVLAHNVRMRGVREGLAISARSAAGRVKAKLGR